MPAPPPPPSSPAIENSLHSFTPIDATQSADCGASSLEVCGINLATETNTDAGPGMKFGPTKERGPEQDPILDYEDNYMEEMFSSKGVGFETAEDVLMAINEYHESPGNVLSTVRTRGNARTFVPRVKSRHERGNDNWVKGLFICPPFQTKHYCLCVR
ncbi:hypothetical protein IV203_007157 [Nitzschia inconspicua]|uniref:Uncharacterized protein n=1 Tax=Nitzschia inconspicua TaxID=303405 RepID=A0A9K3KEA0_9STRA|nr:hypothetical protein IV203_007157 [Nitzschia inconspicua]